MSTVINRAIVLTPPGAAAIAVVRLVGPRVESFLREHFSREAKPGRCVHGQLSDGARVIDDPVVVLLNIDAADLNLHGGIWVVRSLLDLATRSGFEIVDSFADAPIVSGIEGKSLLEREVAAAIPEARTELGLRILLEQVAAWRRFISASPPAEALREVLDDKTLHYFLNPPVVAIVGAANVGKSTLANQLFGQERSITADLPGTTRDWVGEIANVNGLPVMLVDTPGLRSTDDLIERAAIERSRTQIEQASCIVLVLDASRSIEPEQGPLLRSYPDAIYVINKSDQSSAWEFDPEYDCVRTVATSGQGVDELRQAITDRFGCPAINLEKPRWWTERQKGVLQAGIDNRSGLSLDAFS